MTTVRDPAGRPRPVRLRDLVRVAGEGVTLDVAGDLPVAGLAFDSRRVHPGDVFFCIPGTRADGHAYADDARRRGAAALVAERPTGVDLPTVLVPSARRALGRAADLWWGDPSRALDLVGVTGTNGKTTTATIVRQVLEATDRPCGLLGTVGARVGDRRIDLETTTPDPVAIRRHLAGMVREGCEAAAMEVSSHALDQDRTHGLSFRVGVFTNLSGDHLDYHGTLEAYRDAKARLFAGLGPSATAVVNADDPAGDRMAAATRARVLTYGIEADDADVRASALRLDARGTRFRLHLPDGGGVVRLPLVGRHNVENALAAAGACLAVGLDAERVRCGLEACRAPAGRLEPVASPDGVICFVDYAHTDDALRRVLDAVGPLAEGRVLCVFGCGGDRDRTKRPRMGRAVEERADRVIVTSDNPRTEDPDAIIADILEGLERPDEAVVEPDRRAAIRRAARVARPSDVVLICGKGHETHQILGTTRIPFSDVEEARKALSDRSGETPVRRAV